MLASLPCLLRAFVPLHSCQPSRMPLSHASLSLSFQSTPSRLQTSQLGDTPLPMNPCRVLPQPLLWTHNMDAKCTACTACAVPTRKTFTVTGADHHSHPCIGLGCTCHPSLSLSDISSCSIQEPSLGFFLLSSFSKINLVLLSGQAQLTPFTTPWQL